MTSTADGIETNTIQVIHLISYHFYSSLGESKLILSSRLTQFYRRMNEDDRRTPPPNDRHSDNLNKAID